MDEWESLLEDEIENGGGKKESRGDRYISMLNEKMNGEWLVPRWMIKSYVAYHENVTRKMENSPSFFKGLANVIDSMYSSFLIGRLPAKEQNIAADITGQRASTYSLGNEFLATALMSPVYLVLPLELAAPSLGLSLARTAVVCARQKALGPINPETLVYKTGQFLFGKKRRDK